MPIKVMPLIISEDSSECGSEDTGPTPASVLDSDNRVLHESYTADHKRIAKYLTTLVRPEDVSRKDFRQFKNRALKYMVQIDQLYRRATKGAPFRRVVDNTDQQSDIMKQLHDDSGHCRKEGTYQKVSTRYY